jgi:hypothetical protein
MKKRTGLILAGIVAFFGVVAVVVYLAGGALETTLQLRVVDSVSGAWVWNATVRLQDRVMRSFYQADQGAAELRFTRLKPGRAEIEITAPSYESRKVEIRLRRGRNSLPEPIRMQGLEIPQLSHFIVVDKRDKGAFVLEVRPVGTDEKAVLNHPCLDIWIGGLISAQAKGGRYTVKSEDSGSERAEPLFAGKLDWSWDATPETSFRYAVPMPLDRMRPTQAQFWVVDTLIAVPKPGKITPAELDGIMKKAYELRDAAAIAAYLDAYKDRFVYYLPPTLWNVKGGAS